MGAVVSCRNSGQDGGKVCREHECWEKKKGIGAQSEGRWLWSWSSMPYIVRALAYKNLENQIICGLAAYYINNRIHMDIHRIMSSFYKRIALPHNHATVAVATRQSFLAPPNHERLVGRGLS